MRRRWWRVLASVDARVERLARRRPGLSSLAPYAVPALMTVCLLATLAPLLVTRDVPLVDLPTNLATVHVWHEYDDPRLELATYYDRNIELVPYWGYYGLLHAFTYAMPLRWANKLFIMLTIASMFAGSIALLRAHQRPAILAIGALFSLRKQLELVAEQGDWRLWKRRAGSPEP